MYSIRTALIKYVQDLCNAALRFGFDTLRTGGHFVCKYYQGAEEKALETRLKALFAKVHREKPESSRSVSLVHIIMYDQPLISPLGIEGGILCRASEKGGCR